MQVFFKDERYFNAETGYDKRNQEPASRRLLGWLSKTLRWYTVPDAREQEFDAVVHKRVAFLQRGLLSIEILNLITLKTDSTATTCMANAVHLQVDK